LGGQLYTHQRGRLRFQQCFVAMPVFVFAQETSFVV
jgi:hypothetical protein